MVDYKTHGNCGAIIVYRKQNTPGKTVIAMSPGQINEIEKGIRQKFAAHCIVGVPAFAETPFSGADGMVGDIKAGIRTHTGKPEIGPSAQQVKGEKDDCESGDFNH